MRSIRTTLERAWIGPNNDPVTSPRTRAASDARIAYAITLAGALAATVAGWQWSLRDADGHAAAVVAPVAILIAVLIGPPLLRTAIDATVAISLAMLFIVAAGTTEAASDGLVTRTLYVGLAIAAAAAVMGRRSGGAMQMAILSLLAADVLLAYGGDTSPAAWRPLTLAASGPPTSPHPLLHLAWPAGIALAGVAVRVVASRRRRLSKAAAPNA